MQFLDILDAHLSETEMSNLCRQFGVAFNAFPGATPRDRTREFLGFISRQGRMTGLAEATVALRPDLTAVVAELYESKEQELSWLDKVAGGDGQPQDSALTWRWSDPSGKRATQADVSPSPADDAGDVPAEEPESPLPVGLVNPYTPGEKVTDDAMFFGRQAEREQLLQQLDDGAHVVIIGGRNFGGSSLLHRAARDMESRVGVLVAYIDMKEPDYQTVAGLLNSIWTQWWGRVRPGSPVLVRTLAEFVTAVRKLNTAGYRPLLFIDELEQLAWRPAIFDNNLFNAWHELGREGLMGLAMTAHAAPADLLVQSPHHTKFYELFQQLNLGLLDESAAIELLTVPVQEVGLNCPEGAAEYLYLHAGPHPFFLHLAGLYLFDALAKSAYSRGEVIRQFEIAAEPYWQELWESLSPLAQTHYPATLIRATDGMGGRQLRILANRGLVIADGEGFRPFSDGFARWLSRLHAAMQAAAAIAPIQV